MKRKINLWLLLLALGLCSNALAQDSCGSATNIPLSTNNNPILIAGTNTGATNSSPIEGLPTGSCNFSGGDIWFSTLVPPSGEVEFDVIADVWSTAYAQPYTGHCGGGLVSLGNCNNLNSATYTVNAAPASTVYWRMWDWGNNNIGAVTVAAYDTDTAASEEFPLCLANVTKGTGTKTKYNDTYFKAEKYL